MWNDVHGEYSKSQELPSCTEDKIRQAAKQQKQETKRNKLVLDVNLTSLGRV